MPRCAARSSYGPYLLMVSNCHHTRGSSSILPIEFNSIKLIRRFPIIPFCLLIGIALSGCSLFSTREPEDPLTESGTFIQPDTPEQVVENLQAAVAELNTLNYRRSIAESFVFRPTATAVARESLFSSWSKNQEEQYFSAMSAAASLNSGHSLQLSDQSFTLIDAGKFLLDATYVLTINHRRTEVPVQVQGRLRWLIEQSSEGLWSLTDWTDQELGSEASWSDLKAEFMK